MAEILTIYVGDPRNVTLDLLKNDITGAYVNDATVVAEIRSQTTAGASEDDTITSGTRIGSQFTLTYVAASNGKYRGTFPASDAAGLVSGSLYWLWVTASGYTLRRLARIAGYRGET